MRRAHALYSGFGDWRRQAPQPKYDPPEQLDQCSPVATPATVKEVQTTMTLDARQLLRDMFEAAVGAALPKKCLPPHLPARPAGRTIVVGAGKAGGSMAKAVEDHWQGPLEGLVVTRYGHGAPCQRIEVIEAGHPVPDAAGQEAAERILAMVNGLTADDLVLCLISGRRLGASRSCLPTA